MGNGLGGAFPGSVLHAHIVRDGRVPPYDIALIYDEVGASYVRSGYDPVDHEVICAVHSAFAAAKTGSTVRHESERERFGRASLGLETICLAAKSP